MIFSREGDRLTLAMSDGVAGRPQNFAPDPDKIVMRLRRANRRIYERNMLAPAPASGPLADPLGAPESPARL